MEQHEAAVRLWFRMWLKRTDLGILDLFTEDAVYIESWGPEYHGAEKIKLWFDEWNTRGTVRQWDIRQFVHKDGQTIEEWYVWNPMNDGRTEAFEGIALVKWSPDGRISYLQEFGCNESRYDPYRDGPEPKFREGSAAWF